MAITYVGFASNTSNYQSSIAVSVPAGTINNDVMIAIVGGTRSGAPSGWTLIDSANSGSSSLGNVYCYYRVASSEPGSYTFSLSGSFLACAAIITYRGVNTSTPVDMVNEDVSAVGATTNFDTATITAGTNTWALSFAMAYEFGSSSTRTFVEGSGSERFEDHVANTPSPDNCNIMVADSNGTVSAGSYSRTQTRSAAASDGVRGILLLKVNAVSGSANTATAGTTATAYSATGQTGTSAAAPKAAVTATAFNPAVFAGHFGFAGIATVTSTASNPQKRDPVPVAATAYSPFVFYGSPPQRVLIVDDENRIKIIPDEVRTAQIESG